MIKHWESNLHVRYIILLFFPKYHSRSSTYHNFKMTVKPFECFFILFQIKPLSAVSITLIATVINGQHSEQTSAPEQQYLTSS